MKTYRIAVLPGDGIGPEVTTEAVRVLDAAAESLGLAFEKTHYPHGAEHYLSTGETFPDEVIEEMRGYDAILLGAIGDPRIEVGMLERAIIAGLRFQLDLYINLRPIKLFDAKLCPLKDKTPADIDMVMGRSPEGCNETVAPGVASASAPGVDSAKSQSCRASGSGAPG